MDLCHDKTYELQKFQVICLFILAAKNRKLQKWVFDVRAHRKRKLSVSVAGENDESLISVHRVKKMKGESHVIVVIVAPVVVTIVVLALKGILSNES